MESWKEQWHNGKTAKRPVFRQLIKQFRKQSPKLLNAHADEVHNEVFSEVDCLQCANCCKSIPPIVNDTDLRRISKYLGTKPSMFANQYLRQDEDGDTVMNTSPCPFLADDNTCTIYHVRPKACRRYPHTDNFEFAKHLDLHLKNVQYCPAVFHILDRMGR